MKIITLNVNLSAVFILSAVVVPIFADSTLANGLSPAQLKKAQANALKQAAYAEERTFDGSENNREHDNWGQANTDYLRLANANYADGISQMVDGPNSRYISNRIFNDLFVNVLDERGLSQFGFVYGQFMDHTIGLAQGGGDAAHIPFDSMDPLEDFTNNFPDPDNPLIHFTRNQHSAGTGITTAREFNNTVSSFIDAWSVYGPDSDMDGMSRVARLQDPLNPAKLAVRTGMDGGEYLPLANTVGITDMAQDGLLRVFPDATRAAGDVRANENIGLTSLHTLFVREHNRIVDLLNESPVANDLNAKEKFHIARAIVAAEQQAIAYEEFLPAMGIELPAYTRYDKKINTSLSNEFAVVGYRAHSMIHGSIFGTVRPGAMTSVPIAELQAAGITVRPGGGGEIRLQVPLNVASFNPDLLEDIGLDNILDGLADGPNYRNDAMHDNQVRSILFQIPNPGFDPTALDGPASIEQFSSVLDLIAIDVERGRDMGMPSYNDLRETYGLPRVISFTEITGESTEDLPAGIGIDDPSVINWKDLEGNELQPEDAPGELHDRGSVPLDIPTESIQMTTVAARLKAIYGTVDAIEAFAGMVSEKHLANSAFGELQDAIWTTQFQTLRDGDRFYYENKNNGLFDKAKDGTYSMAGIPVLHSLHDIIVANTALESGDIPLNVFLPSSGAGSAALLTAAVPEPSTLALTALGLLGIGWRRRKRA